MAARRAPVHLSESERAQIAQLKLDGKSATAISQELGVPLSTVYATLQRLREHHTLHDLPRSGRPRKLQAAQLRDVPQLLKRDHLRTSLDVQMYLAETYGLHVSRKTVLLRLKEMGVKAYHIKPRPLLTHKHRAARVKWCKETLAILRDNPNYFDKVVFSDESTVDRVPKGNNKVRLLPQDEQPHGARSHPRALHGGGSVQVWGAISRHGGLFGHGFLDGTLTARSYINMLKKNLLQPANEQFEDEEWIFQQDNASAHTSEFADEHLDRLAAEFNFTVMAWPAHSPDLSPIENIWSIIKDILSRSEISPDLISLREHTEIVIEQINDPDNRWLFDRLYDSMADRMHEVIHNGGMPGPY